jgi:hypothetical protein
MARVVREETDDRHALGRKFQPGSTQVAEHVLCSLGCGDHPIEASENYSKMQVITNEASTSGRSD